MLAALPTYRCVPRTRQLAQLPAVEEEILQQVSTVRRALTRWRHEQLVCVTRKGALVAPKALSAAGGVGVLGRVPSGHRRGRVGACGARDLHFFRFVDELGLQQAARETMLG